MSSLTVNAPSRSPMRSPTESARRWALGALALGAVSAVVFAGIMVFATLSKLPDSDLTFHHTADYWLAAIGLPNAVAASILLFALWGVQPHARPGLTRVGATMNVIALALLFAILASSVATGTEVRWGPAYPLAVLVTFVGHALFVAGTWRTGLFPKPLLAAWPVIWLMGAFAAQGASPLILAAFYAVMAGYVVRRT